MHNPPLPLMVNVAIFSNDLSYSKIAEVAKALQVTLNEQNIPVQEYSIRIIPLADKPENQDQAVTWANSLSVSDFPAEKMSAENLPQVMEQFEIERITEINEKGEK
jgi:hypothetical protein